MARLIVARLRRFNFNDFQILLATKRTMANSHRLNTPKGEMSGNGSGPAIAHLPPQMRQMFLPDVPVEFKPPLVKRKMPAYQGIAAFVGLFEDTKPEPRGTFEDPLQKRKRQVEERVRVNKALLEEQLEVWDPAKPGEPVNGELTADAFKTLFVARISFDTTAHKLRREFEQFGPIKTLRLVQDKSGDSRGYAFLECVYHKRHAKQNKGARLTRTAARARAFPTPCCQSLNVAARFCILRPRNLLSFFRHCASCFRF